MKPLPERQQEFIKETMEILERIDPLHKINPQWMVQEFINENVQICINSKEILWDWKARKKAKNGVKACIAGALATWRGNSQDWHPNKWKAAPKKEFYKPRTMNEDQRVPLVPNFDYGKFNVK